LRGDLSHTDAGRDELVRRAWEARDSAVARKSAAEVELAKERVASMQVSKKGDKKVFHCGESSINVICFQVNSQLLEAIQQKIELSQQLDDWKSDMEVLLEDQIRERLVDSERGQRRRDPAKTSSSSSASTSSQPQSGVSGRLLSFFGRG